MNDEVINGQLQHHWAGATGGVAFFERVGRTHPDRETAVAVRALAGELRDERESLREIMSAMGMSPSRVATISARAGEWLGRFKPNGRVVRRSPLTDVLELEALRVAVSGKRVGWQFLRELAEHDGRIDPRRIDQLLEQAEAQLETLQDLHLRVAVDRALG